jgi:hypothetical protein
MSVAADAQPDHGTWRVQLLLAARGGQRAELAGRLVEEAPRLAGLGRVIVLAQLDGDLFPLANPLCRPFDAVLEVQRPGPGDPAPIVDGLDKALTAVGELIHPDLSGVLAGWPQDVIPCDPTPVRYLYLMRRKAGTSSPQYLDYYFHHHSRFGFKTPAIDGYTQFHVDSESSAAAARRLGVGVHGADSVSELHLPSLEAFMGAIGDGRLGAEALADEETFVDRDNSVSFCTATRYLSS